MSWDVVFLEAVYQEVLKLEFELRGIPFIREKELRIHYKENLLTTRYRADFVLHDKIVLETKAHESLSNRDGSQVLNYLNATQMKLGLLVNFGSAEGLQSKRNVL